MDVSTKNKKLQDVAGATGNGEILDTVQLSGVGFQVLGTFVGTVTFEGSIDAENWDVIQVKNKATGAITTTATAPGIFVCSVAGVSQVRARISAWASGSITVEAAVSIGQDGSPGDVNINDGLSIAKGEVPGTSFIHKFGAAPDFDVADGFVTVWDAAEDDTVWELMNYVYSATAAIDSISSTAAETQDIEIQGLDANYDLVTQTITLTGTTRKALDTNLIRIFRAKNVDSTNLTGHVIVYENDTTADDAGVPDDSNLIRAIIQPVNNQTEMAVYTIPDGYTGYMRSWYASTAGAKRDSQHTIKILARPFGQVFQLKHKANIAVTGTSYIQHKYEEPEVFAAKTDIEMQMDTDTDVAGVAGGFDIVLVAD